MTDVELLFSNRKADTSKLLDFGFTKKRNVYIYSTVLLDGQFEMKVAVSEKGKVTAEVIDPGTGEIYVPVRIPGATGTFIGRVKAEFNDLLTALSEQCFFPDSFKSKYSEKVISYIKEQYHDAPEFLWPKFPKNAIFRRKDNAKWYAALLNLPKHKVGLEGTENIDIIDLRIDPSSVNTVVDGKKYLPGYHMNKKHWFTICLDGSVPIAEIRKWIDSSYRLAKK